MPYGAGLVLQPFPEGAKRSGDRMQFVKLIITLSLNFKGCKRYHMAAVSSKLAEGAGNDSAGNG